LLTLAHVVVFRKEPIAKIDEGEETEDAIPENKVHGSNVIFDEEPSKLPDKLKSRKTWNTKCKEAIKEVISLTHISVDDTESLKELCSLVHDCINILSNAAQKEEGLVLEKPPTKGTSKSSTSKSSTSESSTSKSSTSKSSILPSQEVQVALRRSQQRKAETRCLDGMVKGPR